MATLNRLARPTRELQDRPLATVRVPKSHRWFRLHGAHFASMHFGTSGDNRFDAPDGRFGMLYLAQQIPGAFVEVFCRQRQHRIAEASLAHFHVAEFHSSRNLRLVDLAGKGLVRMGLDARICTGDYRLAQQWAHAFHEHPDQADGILYVSRHDPHISTLEKLQSSWQPKSNTYWRNGGETGPRERPLQRTLGVQGIH